MKSCPSADADGEEKNNRCEELGTGALEASTGISMVRGERASER